MEYSVINPECLFDTEEMLFGDKVLNEDINIDSLIVEQNRVELDNIIQDCILRMNKLGFNLSYNKIVKLKITTNDKYTAGIKAVGQDLYLLVLNKTLLNKQKYDYLLSAIYHELCHMYQLARLFKEKLIFWNYRTDRLENIKQEDQIIAQHLQTDTGHTQYWLEAKDKVNNNIKLNTPVKVKLTETELRQLFLESFEAEYVDTNFEDWFYGFGGNK